MQLLLTNDDGINAPGLLVLARRLLADGHALTVAAPRTETSGCGTSVGSQLDGHLVSCHRVELPGLDGVLALAVDGPPALAVLAVIHGLADVRPELVVSGINPGHNVGRLSQHSGTLGAATTAASYGLRAIAVSCAPPPHDRYEETAAVASLLVGVVGRRDPDGLVFNLNHPARPRSEVRGVRAASLATPPDGDLAVERRPDGFSIRVARDSSTVGDDSDLALLDDGYISITCVGHRAAGTGVPEDVIGALGSLLDGAGGDSPAAAV